MGLQRGKKEKNPRYQKQQGGWGAKEEISGTGRRT
jgi:hypothetical protein